MAQKILVEMVDDIDGGVANQTVPFSLDGVTYEIDLSEGNAASLRDELARYVATARRTGGRKVRLAAGQSAVEGKTVTSGDRERSRAIRAWAIDNGYPVSERGRIPADVVEAFELNEREPVEVEAPKKTRAPRKKVAAAKA
ncbi:histone-like nucleoid-structuring protein Lsr2 [Amycolatopsis sp. H20-H5]|uniref:histone-like nucleoid-structuring protein Lsr2 n=1 Tax=Amycolatopsis sp. H20-H5 TaxID=3046309 RepID=UPI002DBDAB33|nr:Lsr2 family protein [Amycolatopsis sp. H20-H5]MEC3979910.1 Lsr2 family protein [Amycolatopsis sp. H20-H5]